MKDGGLFSKRRRENAAEGVRSRHRGWETGALRKGVALEDLNGLDYILKWVYT